jgi:hypothetical protein
MSENERSGIEPARPLLVMAPLQPQRDDAGLAKKIGFSRTQSCRSAKAQTLPALSLPNPGVWTALGSADSQHGNGMRGNRGNRRELVPVAVRAFYAVPPRTCQRDPRRGTSTPLASAFASACEITVTKMCAHKVSRPNQDHSCCDIPVCISPVFPALKR